MQQSIGFIGAGHMTTAIVGGLVKHFPANTISVSNRGQQKLVALASKYGINPAPDNASVVANCNIVVLSVKPQLLKSVVESLTQEFQSSSPLVISLAAGIRIDSLNRWLGGSLPIVRGMPNTPCVIGEGVTGLFANTSVADQQRQLADQIFQTVGLTTWVKQEQELDMVTAISGSGPAYFMLFIQSMIEAATARGMSSESAKTLAVQTARGTAGMIATGEKELPQMLQDMLLPGGTTEQAVAVMRQHGVPSAIDDAVEAASSHSALLADKLGR